MHKILQLKGEFMGVPNPSRGGRISLPKNKSVTSQHVFGLRDDLKRVMEYWEKNTEIEGALVSVHCPAVEAKSNRLKRVLAKSSTVDPSLSMCGARFEKNADGTNIHHVFTYYVSLEVVREAVDLLSKTGEILEREYQTIITSEDFVALKKQTFNAYDISKTDFSKIILDCLHTERFDVDGAKDRFVDLNGGAIVTLYRTHVETKELLRRFGIVIRDTSILHNTTLSLMEDELRKLKTKAPYLIAMGVKDFLECPKDECSHINNFGAEIPKPSDEPFIGVIDTPFNESVYFHEWVEYKSLLAPEITLKQDDYTHGTAVSSIIVDGPKGNPHLEDGCGHFRVKHFGVATQKGFHAFTFLRELRSIVAENPEIRVWNLSLGSNAEISDSFISPVAAELDQIQNEFDVIFVVAGTNKPDKNSPSDMKIGSPADSLNSIVVNSVDFQKKAAKYSRRGPALSFFHKPDVCYYGGDGNAQNGKIVVCCSDTGADYLSGTSFAAPWIARKLAYLIHIVGLSRELAKALIIDVTVGWKGEAVSKLMGYGIVPIHIDDILHTSNDEIRFMLQGCATDYETYSYNLPVPMENDKYPFWARATLAYFPWCNREQGVDYTSTEMDVHFGRVYRKKDGKPALKSLNNNKQGELGDYTDEEKARALYRKWDNVKHISDSIPEIAVPKKTYGAGVWGIELKTKERNIEKRGKGLSFGVVVTLKEMHQKDRYDDFIKLCLSRGWLVQQVDVTTRAQVYQQAEADIEFD